MVHKDNHNWLSQFILWLFFIFASLGINNTQAESFEEGKEAYQAKDYNRALEILEPLAEQGNSQAQVTLGIMYDNGHGVPLDQSEAIKWYIKAAKQGVPVVQHDVGVKYFQGQGVKQDYEQAAYWWEQSASAGLSESQFNLGLMYYRGLGIEQDYKKASELFFAAAKQGHGNAQYSLAVMYAFGQGVEKDFTRALPWFRKSAAQGVAQAQFNLGVLYENGHGLEKDLKIAREWYQRAATQGLQDASKKLAELDKLKSTDVITHPDASSLSLASPPPTIASTTPPTHPVSKSGIKREDWVRLQHPKTYTLQLSSVLNEKDVVKFIKENNLGDEAAYIKVVVKGITRFTALYGAFNTFEQAQNAILKLPKNIQQIKPWVRNFGILQELLKKS